MKYLFKNKNYNIESPELVLHELLQDRGINEPEKWLHTDETYEHSPLLLSGMKKATAMLNTTLKNKEASILIVVDSDLDGYTSSAIILNLLRQVASGQDINYVIHPGKEHGIELKDIPEDLDLLIVPDAGSSQKAEHLKLLENGTKIIILDHHEINNDMEYGEYEENIVIVNSQLDYPNPALSGAGVALKFVQAYCSAYKVELPLKLYALAACGIVADVMDISSLENKRIIDVGLRYVAEHPFLMELVKKAHYNMENPMPNIKDIGWVIGPNINAIIRLGTLNQKKMVFLALVSPYALVLSSKRGCEDEEVPVYEEAARLCDNAKKRQTTAMNRSIKTIEQNIDVDRYNFIVYIDEEQDLTFELSGLIANKLLSKYNKPVVLLREYTDNKGLKEYRGSIRGKPAEGLSNLKDTIRDITGVDFVEGHAFAAGIGINKDSIVEFKAHLNSVLDRIDFNTNLYLVDIESPYNKLNINIAQIMAKDNIWSHGVEKPLGVLTGIPSTKYDVMGAEQQHVKIDCGKYDVILFNEPELAEALLTGGKFNIDVVGEFDVDKSYNIGRLQFIVKDYELKDYVQETIWDVVF